MCSNLCPAKIENTEIIFGCEANIIDNDGSLDLRESAMKSLDILLAGFHPFTPYKSGSEKENTSAMIKSIKRNKYIDILAHIGNSYFKVDYEEVIKCLNDYKIIIEINNRSFLPDHLSPRKGSSGNCIEVIHLCEKYKVPIVVSSDAHNQFQVGCCSLAVERLEKENFPEELILNADINKIRNFLNSIHPEKQKKEVLD